MHYRVLGRTGVRVSELCLGTMQFGWTADEETSMRILNAAFKAGINFIDSANIYSRWVEGNYLSIVIVFTVVGLTYTLVRIRKKK